MPEELKPRLVDGDPGLVLLLWPAGGKLLPVIDGENGKPLTFTKREAIEHRQGFKNRINRVVGALSRLEKQTTDPNDWESFDTSPGRGRNPHWGNR